MKYFALFMCLVIAASAINLRTTEFTEFKNVHNKVYATQEEEALRLKIFSSNLLYIEMFNDARTTEHEAILAVNEFADLTNEEFRRTRLAPKGSAPARAKTATLIGDVPDSKDWRDDGCVTPVKDQGQCGSCWSFSTTGAIEGAWCVAGHDLVSLSEQNLMDCSWDYENSGCDGGWPANAMQYVMNNDGIDTEESYPYEEESSHDCRYSTSNIGAVIRDYVGTTEGDEAALAKAVSRHGPLSVAIDASQMSFQFYSSGIYYSKSCKNGEDDLDHGVVVVGYGYEGDDATAEDKQYWIVKNSWNTTWGKEGYIWMARNRDNNCGIATAATYVECDE